MDPEQHTQDATKFTQYILTIDEDGRVYIARPAIHAEDTTPSPWADAPDIYTAD